MHEIIKKLEAGDLRSIAERDERYRPRVISILKDLTERGSAAVKSRGRKLLKKLTRYDKRP